MPWCQVDLICAHCGELHRLSNEAQIRQPPTERATLAEIYGDRLPQDVAGLVREHSVWCPEVGDYIDVRDPAKVILTPLDRPMGGAELRPSVRRSGTVPGEDGAATEYRELLCERMEGAT